jgi:glycosylphosphatidylinositol transamidase (GPIT) subunit GPI8
MKSLQCNAGRKHASLIILALAATLTVGCDKQKAAVNENKEATKEAIDKAQIKANKDALQAQLDADKKKADAEAAAAKAKIDAENK